MNFARGSASPNHVPILNGKHDRFCVWYSGLIPKQNQQKTVVCPHANCRKKLPLRAGTWIQLNNTGMGRCPMCDSFVHKNFLYCQFCRNPNEEGQAKRNEFNERALKNERETTKRLKIELDQLKAERDRQMEVDVGSYNFGAATAETAIAGSSSGSFGAASAVAATAGSSSGSFEAATAATAGSSSGAFGTASVATGGSTSGGIGAESAVSAQDDSDLSEFGDGTGGIDNELGGINPDDLIESDEDL